MWATFRIDLRAVYRSAAGCANCNFKMCFYDRELFKGVKERFLIKV